MASTVIVATVRRILGSSCSGRKTTAYDAARRVHNGLIDRRPALIARCHSTADIVDAVRFARAEGLEISVRGGGHNVAGRAVIDDALMIDLSPMKGIHVDPAAGRRCARRAARSGGELNRETALHGLAVTGGAISHTGIAGLTLGGGLGWLMAKHGLAADNLISVELVTADGSVRRGERESRLRPALGTPRRWRQLRHRGVARVPAVPADDGHRRPDRPSARARRRGPALLPRCGRERLRRSDRVHGARPSAGGAARDQGRRDGRVPHGHRGGGRARARPVQGMGAADHGRGRTHAVPGHEHPARRRVSDRLAQLLALELHDRSRRRADRRDGRAPTPVGPVARDRAPARALPRRRVPASARPTPRCRTGGGLEPRHPRHLVRPGRHRRERRLGARDARGARSRTSARRSGSTTWPTTRATTPSGPPTARTTTGCARSSSASTPETSSGTTTTSSRKSSFRRASIVR